MPTLTQGAGRGLWVQGWSSSSTSVAGRAIAMPRTLQNSQPTKTVPKSRPNMRSVSVAPIAAIAALTGAAVAMTSSASLTLRIRARPRVARDATAASSTASVVSSPV